MLLQIFREGTRPSEVVENALPCEARLIGVSFDGRTLFLTVEGPGLPLVREGDKIPEVDVLFRSLESWPAPASPPA